MAFYFEKGYAWGREAPGGVLEFLAILGGESSYSPGLTPEEYSRYDKSC